MSFGAVIASVGAGTLVKGAATVGAGLLAADAARSGARKQRKASQRAIDEQTAAREQAREDLEPFRQLGAGVSSPLLDFVLEGPETELERTRGFRDIQTSAAAGGKLRSGGTLEELTEFNNLLNSRNRQTRFNELFNLASLGSNAAARQGTATLGTANNISSLNVGAGNVAGAARVASGNAQGQTISDLAKIIAKRVG